MARTRERDIPNGRVSEGENERGECLYPRRGNYKLIKTWQKYKSHVDFMKIYCNRCKKTKRDYEFYHHPTTINGFSIYCKQCMREITREYEMKIKLLAINHYGGKCACCGEKNIEFLVIDHVNNDGAKHRLQICGKNSGGKRLYRWLKKNNYPDKPKLQVLCHNCNAAKEYYGYCPHQR